LGIVIPTEDDITDVLAMQDSPSLTKVLRQLGSDPLSEFFFIIEFHIVAPTIIILDRFIPSIYG
jgi:hypothetical protein